jgi:hypothetical protein
VKRVALFLAIVAVAACGSLPDPGDGIVELQLYTPDSLVVVVDSGSVTLHAVALDIHGDSIPAAISNIRWQTPDTQFVALDSVTGVMTGKAVGQARVQATAGTLRSDGLLSFVVRAPDSTAATTVRQRP